MTEECPNCGAPVSETVTVGRGDRYEAVFGRPPRSLFAEYARVCPAPDAAHSASRQPTVEVFLHRYGDFESAVGPAD
ncbi:MAG: hypothetical protein ABEH78_11435 [Haloferacaceae archaeon]